MATDGPDPPKCDEELYKDGVVAGIFGTFGANHFESLIVDLRSRLEVSIDWHYVGGRAVVKCWPSGLEKVRQGLNDYVLPALLKKNEESNPRRSVVVENLFHSEKESEF